MSDGNVTIIVDSANVTINANNGNVTIKDVEYKNYGKCKVISNGLIEMYVTTEIGPRIIKLNLCGKENLMFNDIDRAMAEDISAVFGENKKWYIYGGHRLWVSPEAANTYYPDNDPVAITINGSSVVFTPPPQEVNNLQHSMEITMCADKPCAYVTHKVINVGDEEMTGAIWALSVMTDGGTVICPQPDEDTKLLGNRILALWPYTRMTDDRAHFFDKYITMKQDKACDEKFKFGINNTKGWIAYQNHGQILKKTYEPNHPNGNYPDFGCSTEAFTNHLFAEAETLSELKTLKKGEFIVHTERFELIEAPDINVTCQTELEAYVDKYIL